ncbi:AAA family ATPase [Streptomyces spororaveus]|uniref:AAA family ATPase n=1 Tax=Streptomyces spororaveus TaxID=284039 RepID=UPI0037A8FF86
MPGLRGTTKEQLTAGHDVVVDHGFWTPEDRAKWRSIAIDAGAIPVLVYLAASHEELWARISQRNEQHANDPNAIYFSESDLQRPRTRSCGPGQTCKASYAGSIPVTASERPPRRAGRAAPPRGAALPAVRLRCRLGRCPAAQRVGTGTVPARERGSGQSTCSPSCVPPLQKLPASLIAGVPPPCLHSEGVT